MLDSSGGVLAEGSALTILPVLRLQGEGFSISLKLGEGRQSFIRDLPGFFQALRDRTPFPISKTFTFSPAWMELDANSQALCRLLSAFYEGQLQADLSVPGSIKRDLPLPDAQLRLVMDQLVQMRFLVISPKGQYYQEGIQEEQLPLLFSLGYDIRGVVLRYAWQEELTRLTTDGSYAHLQDRIICLSKMDAALLRILPLAPLFEETSLAFTRSQTPRVFADLLPFLQRGHAVVLEEDLQKRLSRQQLKTRIYLDREGSGIAARVRFLYADHEIDPLSPSDKLPVYLLRDAAGERQVMDLLASYRFRARPGRADLQDENLIFDFFMQGVAQLHRLGEVYLSEGFRLLTPRAPAFSGHLRLKSGRLGLVLADGDIQEEELLPLLRALAQRKRYFRYKSGAFITLDDAQQWQALSAAYLEGVRQDQLRDARDLPAMRAAYLSALIEKDNLPVSLDSGAQAAVALNPEDVKSPVKGLHDYQLRGLRWLVALHQLGLGGILADEMGLGKTVQMIAAIKHFVNSDIKKMPSLIVAPTTLIYNWQKEIQRFAPDLSCQVIAGGRQLRERALEEALKEEVAVIITSYPLLRQDIDLYTKVRFRFAALDEAQNIKNFTSQTARVAKRLNAQTRIALTGTPMENNIAELWSLFDFVMPGYLQSAREFLRSYEDGKQAAELRLRIRPFLLRRLKSEVMSQLPEKLATSLSCEMGPEQRRVYQAALARSRAQVMELLSEKGLDVGRIQVLAAITQLRQICCHPKLVLPDYKGQSAKLELLMDLLPEALQSGRRILLFSQFTSMLAIIQERLNQAGIPSLYLDGETPPQDRLQLAERFNQGLDAPIFLISLKAGGTGLNLTGADMVIHFDPWWNPTAEDQANDRAHRLGQDKPVQVLHLLTLRSIEEAVVEMGSRKRRLFDRLITPGEALPHRLSQEDVLRLFEQ